MVATRRVECSPTAGVAEPGRSFLGVLMLDTAFPRPPGDIGNAHTFARAGIPVRYSTVAGASPRRIVGGRDPRLLQPFVDAAAALVKQGAAMVSTSCGFLAAWQTELQAAVPVPVIASSLLQVRHCLRPGIVTIDSAALDEAVLRGAGVPPGTPVQGVAPGCEFHRRILGNEAGLDLQAAEQDVVAAAMRLVAQHPDVRSLVLECTNMPPYREAVARATGRPVHDIETLLLAAWRGRGGQVLAQSPAECSYDAPTFDRSTERNRDDSPSDPADLAPARPHR